MRRAHVYLCASKVHLLPVTDARVGRMVRERAYFDEVLALAKKITEAVDKDSEKRASLEFNSLYNCIGFR